MSESLSRQELFRRAFGRLRAAGERIESTPTFRLRPPGALRPDAAFLAACTACGDCAPACHQNSIRLDGGVPFIEPSLRPCFLCTEPPCVTACKDGALLAESNGRRHAGNDIRLGLAVVERGLCIAWSDDDEHCRVCYDACPLPEVAIRLDARSRPEILADCTGCGICEWKCPTEPPAVRIRPIA